MKNKTLEYFARQAIIRVTDFLNNLPLNDVVIEERIYSDVFKSEGKELQVGFSVYQERGKSLHIGPSVSDEFGIGEKPGLYHPKDILLTPDFIVRLIDEYIGLIEEVVRSSHEMENRFTYDDTLFYEKPSRPIIPSPFRSEVTEEIYLKLGLDKDKFYLKIKNMVDFFLKNMDSYIVMHRIYWGVNAYILTRVSCYEIGIRIRYDGHQGGGFCPICRGLDGDYWQMETTSFHQVKDEPDYIENLSAYYIHLLSIQRGYIEAKNQDIEIIPFKKIGRFVKRL